MMPAAATDLTLRLTTGWNAAVGARMLMGVFGLLILGLAARTLWRRSGSRLVALLWLPVGAVGVVFALAPQRLVDVVIQTDYVQRVRMMAGGISALVLLITFEALRRTQLQERYALLWVATALVILVAALFPGVVALFRAVTGMTYAGAVLAVTFTFLALVAFHFSISISGFQARQDKIAQRVAVLEARLSALEAARRGDET
jgi:hypothetical protein